MKILPNLLTVDSFLYNPTNLKVPKKAPCVRKISACVGEGIMCLGESRQHAPTRSCSGFNGSIFKHY